MKLLVAAIGLLKSGAEKELAADYEARIKTTGKQVGISALADYNSQGILPA